jgi:tRNA threonylcarbamoyladenosine biosynthesis protein TsaB
MANILAFDTSTAACSVALSLDGDIQQRFELAPRRHGALLLSMMDSLLKTAALSLNECDAIAMGHGPGSFMGLRIAAGVAQGLAFGAQLPVISVSSLQALAQAAYWSTPADTILAGWDARMQQVYWGLYRCKHGRMENIVADQLSAPDAIDLTAYPDALMAGNAWPTYFEGKQENTDYPTAAAVAFLAEKKQQDGDVILPEQITLSYLRNKVADKPKRLR